MAPLKRPTCARALKTRTRTASHHHHTPEPERHGTTHGPACIEARAGRLHGPAWARLLSRIAAATSGRQEADERCDDGEATYVDERLRVQVLIFVSLPRTSSSPTKERSCGAFSRASRVDSATRIDRPVV